jgi:hypothetical protein
VRPVRGEDHRQQLRAHCLPPGTARRSVGRGGEEWDKSRRKWEGVHRSRSSKAAARSCTVADNEMRKCYRTET